jgi:hypothetical protein
VNTNNTHLFNTNAFENTQADSYFALALLDAGSMLTRYIFDQLSNSLSLCIEEDSLRLQCESDTLGELPKRVIQVVADSRGI